jgi:hypothetical protein
VNELKAFFLKTIQTVEVKTKETEKKDEKEKKGKRYGDYRWKKVVNKSNRKKKELETLFKTRPVFGTHQTNQARQTVKDILTGGLERPQGRHIEKLLISEFDDETLYCPWSYREEAL